MAIGDVAGHGLVAVAEMAHIRFGLRSLAYLHDDPTEVLAQLSELAHVFTPDTMITALYGTLDPRSGCFEYALAGICRRCSVASRRACWSTNTADPPLGLGTRYQRRRLVLDAATTLVAVTDGIIERRSESITVSLDRLLTSCESGRRAPAALCEHLMLELLPRRCRTPTTPRSSRSALAP